MRPVVMTEFFPISTGAILLDRSTTYLWLARAQLTRYQLDTAAQALAGVLALDPQMRMGGLAQQLESCRQLLAGSAYRRSATARQPDRQLAASGSDCLTSATFIVAYGRDIRSSDGFGTRVD